METINDAKTKLNEEYLILDWAGNLKFNGQTFNSESEAWEYCEEFMADGEDVENFQVILKSDYKGL